MTSPLQKVSYQTWVTFVQELVCTNLFFYGWLHSKHDEIVDVKWFCILVASLFALLLVYECMHMGLFFKHEILCCSKCCHTRNNTKKFVVGIENQRHETPLLLKYFLEKVNSIT